MSSHVSHPVALPKCWTRHVRSALLQAISLAATAWTLARSRAATSRRQRKRLQVALPNYGVGAALGSCKVFPCHWIGTVSASRESLDHYTKVRSPQTNGICERFHQTILQDFFRVEFRKRLYTDVTALQRDLDSYLEGYNTRPHQGKRCDGKTPTETFQQGKAIVEEKKIA